MMESGAETYRVEDTMLRMARSQNMMDAQSYVTPTGIIFSLGIYFAEHNKGAFANHFITFSERPRLVELKGSNIVDKVKYCMTFNECANTNLEVSFSCIELVF